MNPTKKRIAIVPGDGIGQEVVPLGVDLIKTISKSCNLNLQFDFKDWGADKWLATGKGVVSSDIEDLQRNYDAIYFGAVGDPRIPDMAHGREILLKMRFELDLFVNLRPIKLLNDRFGVLKHKNSKDIDFVIIRENTEDSYVSIGGNFKKGTADEVAMDQSVHTKKGVERIIRYAFDFAKKSNRKKVTLGDKANAIVFGGSLWQRTFAQVSKDYPEIQTEHMYVDVMAMEFVRAPERFSVVVTSNLFGDILSDLGAGIAGGLGLAPSANINPNSISLFEPVHGSAPSIAGTNQANPLAAFLTAALMLNHLGHTQAGDLIESAVLAALNENILTPEMGGKATTTEVARFVQNYAEKR